MSDEEFNRLTQELCAGLSITMVLNRLMLALRAVVEDTGEAGANALHRHCGRRRQADNEDYFSEGPL